MNHRVVHIIHSECDVYVEKTGSRVRVRLAEKDPELINPTDFEIEGNPEHIGQAFSTIAEVLANLDAMNDKAPN